MRMSIKRRVEQYHAYYQQYSNQLQRYLQHKLFREFVLFAGVGLLIGIYLFVSGFLYLGLAGLPFDQVKFMTIVTVAYSFMTTIHHAPLSFTIFLLAALLPVLWGVGFYQCFKKRKQDDGRAMRIWCLVSAGIILWLTCNDTLVQFSLTHKLIIGSPFEYVRLWLFYHSNLAIKKHLIAASFIGLIPLLIVVILLTKDRMFNLYGNAHVQGWLLCTH